MKVFEPYIPYLYQALEARFGVVIQTSSVKLSRAHLYQARANQLPHEEGLARLQFRPDPHNPNQLWILKGPELSEQANGAQSRTA